MGHRQQYNTSGRRRRRSPLGKLLTFAFICLVLFLGITAFFRVNEIEVSGDTRYSRSEVIEASEIEFGSHLFLLRADTARANILSRLPYAGHVEVLRQFPSRVEIIVTEALPVAFLQTEGGYLLLDRSARILERTEHRPIQRLVELQGFETPILPREGEVLALGEEGRAQLLYVQDILYLFSSLGLAPWISELDMTYVQSPQFIYDARFTVLLGPRRDVRHDMNMFIGILAELDEDESGMIDLRPENPFFRQAEIEHNA